MHITKLFSASLPPITLSLGDRIERLYQQGLQMSIYARNFISPPFLRLSADGQRELFSAVFEVGVTTEQVLTTIRQDKEYECGLIEDFLAVLSQSECGKKIGPALVCPGARFQSPEPTSGQVTPYVALGDSLKEHEVGLAPDDVTWSPGVVFLLFKK